MTLVDLFGTIAQLSGLLFVVTSMLAMGLSLTISQIIQPLNNLRLVVLALLANFVLVPLLAYVITQLIPLEQSLQIGLILLATAAGAPFLPKLVQGAKGNVAFGVGLMVLLMIVTIVYVPIVIPFLIKGVEVNPWDIAQSLIVLMLIPLAIGLLIKSHSPESAAQWQAMMNKISSLAILLLLVVGLGLNASNILSLITTGGLLALLIFIIGSLLIGMLLGGGNSAVRNVMGLGTAQRNVSAAIVVAAQNFSEGNTLVFILVASIFLLLILLPSAKRMGRHSEAAGEMAASDTAT
jgi:BASS family bile acid:Na+ symporter